MPQRQWRRAASAQSQSDPVRSRWTAVAAFTVLAASTQVAWLGYAPVTGIAADHFGVSESAIGWLANMFPLWFVVLAIPAGRILDRHFKAGMAAGALLTAAGAVLRWSGDSYGWALVGQSVIAIGQPLVLNAIPAVARNHLAEKDRARGIAIASAGMFSGMVAAFALGVVLPDAGQFTTLVGIGSALACAAALAQLATLRHPVRAASGPAAPDVTVRATLSDPFVRRMCMVVFFPFGTFSAITTFTETLLEPAGVHADVASVMLVVGVVAGVAGSALVPVAAARHGREARTIVAGLLVAAVCCVLLAVAPSVPVGFAGLALIGFGLLPSLPIILELLERRTGDSEGTAAGLVMFSGNLGALVVTGAVGLLVHEPAVAFLLCATGAVVAALLLRRLGRPVPVEAQAVHAA
ncbi:MFS transporter [Streptomyces sp. NPDC005648]|uniref:MFS transporter n=1 Tax=Streptomyces sp. NPDC005648 TaxID=3157044 RepID=UPI0033AE8C47